jgi:flagellar biosynthesis protein FlhF
MTPTPSPSQDLFYRFVVTSADQAVAIIRERLGPRAHVLSVKSLEASGLRRFWTSPKLEVVAKVEPEVSVEDAPSAPMSANEAAPMSRFAPAVPPSLPALLRRSGVSEIALGRLQCDPIWPALLALPLHRALVELGLRLNARATKKTPRRPLSRAAFLGTAGSGRSTALCKWLGVEVFRNERCGRVAHVEFDQPNPAGSLPLFCEALGVPFSRFPASEPRAPGGGFTYFDLPALSLGDPAENAPIARFLDRERVEQRVLVLNMAYDQAVLRSAYAAGRALGATHLVFTHLDEVQQLGRVWEYLCDGALEPLFLASGPSLTGNCDEDVWGAVIRKTLGSAAFEAEAADDSIEANAVELSTAT